MRTITEFTGFQLQNALKTEAQLTQSGKSGAELTQALGEALKMEGEKLTSFSNAMNLVRTKSNGLKRVVVIQLAENEKPPRGAMKAPIPRPAKKAAPIAPAPADTAAAEGVPAVEGAEAAAPAPEAPAVEAAPAEIEAPAPVDPNFYIVEYFAQAAGQQKKSRDEGRDGGRRGGRDGKKKRGGRDDRRGGGGRGPRRDAGQGAPAGQGGEAQAAGGGAGEGRGDRNNRRPRRGRGPRREPGAGAPVNTAPVNPNPIKITLKRNNPQAQAAGTPAPAETGSAPTEASKPE